MTIKTAKEVAILLSVSEVIKTKTANKDDDNKSKLLQFMEYLGTSTMAAFVTAPVKAVSGLFTHSPQPEASTDGVIRSIVKESIQNVPALKQSISKEIVRAVPRASVAGIALFLGHQAYQAFCDYRKERREEEGLKMKPEPVEYIESESDQSLYYEEKQTKQEVSESLPSSIASSSESQEPQTIQPVRSETEELAFLVSY